MPTYRAFYNGKEIEVKAESSYAAQLKAATLFKVKQAYKVTVILLSKDDIPVVHTPDF
jgi:hypothetical protein